MNTESERPSDHQAVIKLMQEAKAPPADAETPAMPPELLERLREQYGSTEPVRRREIVQHKPSVWAWISDLFVQPQFALASVLILAGVTATIMFNSRPQDDLLRGGHVTPHSIPAYWLTDKAEPAPTGLGLPKFILITALDQLPKQGAALVFDPAKREVRALHDGQVQSTSPISDPTDNDEWLTAQRQLNQQLHAP